MKIRILSILVLSITLSYGQYEPQALNYGLSLSKTFRTINEAGVGARIEYAYNCYTTFMGEYHRSIAWDTSDAATAEGYNEIALGVNIIMFNWYPTTITGGIGYIGNDAPFFETIEDDALLFFQTSDFVHGAQIKLRALHQISPPIHLFAEFNLKSIGRRFDTFVIGVSYDFAE